MNTTSRPARPNPRTLAAVGLACAVVWLSLGVVFRAEDGLGADITWLISTIVAVVGIVAFVSAGVVTLRHRR